MDEFLSYAAKVEEDAATHYDQLAKHMKACGDDELANLFQQLADSAKLHVGEAKARAGSLDDSKSFRLIMSGPSKSPPNAARPSQAMPP
ncbi:MAG TPA: ferritin family protein [Methyloceanibacter sp.]|nr:ferritin family protein [Methyloceanibacter sp.]